VENAKNGGPLGMLTKEKRSGGVRGAG